MANVVRHAGAQHAAVSVSPSGNQLNLTIADDGPAGEAWQPGVGLRSITEPAAELGGHAAAGPTSDGGRVVAVLPLAANPVIRVAVADDHPMVRDGLRALLTSLSTTELVGEAATGREAVRATVTERPDVLLMDLHMPELDGVAATSEIARMAPSVAVLVLSMLDDDQSVFAAMRAGAAATSGWCSPAASRQRPAAT